MTTIPEGMSLDNLAQVIDRVSLVQGLGDEVDAQITENAPETGSHKKLEETTKSERVIKINPIANSVGKDPIMVKVVGFNTIAPVNQDPDFLDTREVVADNEFVDNPQDQIYEENPLYRARTKSTVVPGQLPTSDLYYGSARGSIRQSLPSSVIMQAPDKISYDQSSTEVPDTDERQRIHSDYASESELPNSTEAQLLGGVLRIPEDSDFGQIDAIVSIAATVANIGATGYGIYAKKRQAQQARKQAAQAAAAQAAQSAALFNQQFGQQMGQVPVTVVAPGQSVVAPGTIAPMPALAPLTVGGVDITKYVVYGGVGLVLLIGLVMVVRS